MGAGTDALGDLAACVAGLQNGRGHTDMGPPPLRAGAAGFSLVDSLERTESLSAAFFQAGNKINRLPFAASWRSLGDRQPGS